MTAPPASKAEHDGQQQSVLERLGGALHGGGGAGHIEVPFAAGRRTPPPTRRNPAFGMPRGTCIPKTGFWSVAVVRVRKASPRASKLGYWSNGAQAGDSRTTSPGSAASRAAETALFQRAAVQQRDRPVERGVQQRRILPIR